MADEEQREAETAGQQAEGADFALELARYELGEPLGEGGMAVVYLAEDRALNRRVAIKCLRPEHESRPDFKARFFDEAEIMAALDHPGSIPVYEAGKLPEGALYYAMKRVQGKTFQDLLDERSKDEVRSRHTLLHMLRIFERACETVAYAHARDIIHRDLKPENIMVDDYGAVYVMDWGLAKRVPRTEQSDAPMRTKIGTVMGTPAYMSPEQARGAVHQADTQSDVFSLGVILYVILTGIQPFRGDTDADAMKGVMFHEPDDPRKLNPRASRALSAVCMKALDKDPYRRYPSAKALAEDIRSYLEFRPVSAIAPRAIDRLYNWSRRQPVHATAAATLAALALLASSWLGIQASVENHIVGESYENIERLQASIAADEQELAGLGERLTSKDVDGTERALLKLRVEELRAGIATRREVVRTIASAIAGLTLFSPEARAQQVLRDELGRDLQRFLDDGELYRAREALVFTLRSAEVRNFLAVPDEALPRLRATLEQVERRIAEREADARAR